MKIIEKMRLADGREIIFKYPTIKDVKQVHSFYNVAIKETEFLSRINPSSLKDSKTYMEKILKKMKKHDASYIVAECGGKIIGSSTIERKQEEVHMHVGMFGIAILQEYTSKKIGTRLIQLIELDARKIKIEIIQFGVYGKNKIAQGLYNKMGFTEAGRIPLSVRHRNSIDDEVFMYKVLKK